MALCCLSDGRQRAAQTPHGIAACAYQWLFHVLSGPHLLCVFGCATQQAVPPEKPGQQSDFEELCENLRIKKPRRVLITDPATKLSQRDISFMLIAVLLFGTGLLLFESCFSLDSIALATFR